MNNNYITILFLLYNLTTQVQAIESTCYGTTRHGRLENAIALPVKGNNFVSYSVVADLLGRTYVHSKVYEVVISAYKMLETEQPEKVFKYAETGYKNGGKFKPHKTHQNGLSVDFMTPVLKNKRSAHLPTHPLNKFGYSIDFDLSGRYKEYRIDYESLAAHLVSLHKSAKKHNIKIWRVIFDPKLQVNLYKTKYADYIKKYIQLSKKPSWVRHDEHYHVDFIARCKSI